MREILGEAIHILIIQYLHSRVVSNMQHQMRKETIHTSKSLLIIQVISRVHSHHKAVMHQSSRLRNMERRSNHIGFSWNHVVHLQRVIVNRYTRDLDRPDRLLRRVRRSELSLAKDC